MYVETKAGKIWCICHMKNGSVLCIFNILMIGTKLAKRLWTSINVGTEIYVSNRQRKTAEWTVNDFDVFGFKTKQNILVKRL